MLPTNITGVERGARSLSVEMVLQIGVSAEYIEAGWTRNLSKHVITDNKATFLMTLALLTTFS